MRDSELLRVLLDDKKFAAKIKELQDAEKTLSATMEIKLALEQVKAMEVDLAVRLQEVEDEKVAIAEHEKERVKELADQVRAHQLEVDQKASLQQEQYKDAHKILGEAKKLEADYQLVGDEYNKERWRLIDWEKQLAVKERILADKIKRINEVYNG